MTSRPVFNKSYNEIIKEWDNIALLRLNQIESGQDLSFIYVLAPAINEFLRGCNLSKVVDLGCSSGSLTRMIAKKANHVIGVDISGKNIELARAKSSSFSNIDYVNMDIKSFVVEVKQSSFTTAVAGMTLMDVLHLDEVLKNIKTILQSEGHFIFTIPHPCYWPIYLDYAKAEWFDYRKEIPIETDFKISLDKHEGHVTTHIHRPLEMYFNSLVKTGFNVLKIIEPIPSQEIQSQYPFKWEYPRFIGFHCILNKE